MSGEPAACSKAFTTTGSEARSLAIILLKWRREYYPPREACCPGSSDPSCDCTWGGYKYDELPTPDAYERIFSDECDGHTSMNRALHRITGGQITFESNATARKVNASPNGADRLAGAGGKVDVYGWAVLDRMRDAQSNICIDWCEEAKRLLSVSARSHQHFVCFPLYKPDQAAAPAVCDNLCPDASECAASCPSEGPYSQLPGCGCGTCYWAWGGQWSCGSVSQRKRHLSGFAAPTETWGYRGAIKMIEGHKVYMTHELGHNLGLTHAASMVCPVVNGSSIDRRPTSCRPDWYGDITTFMGGGSSLTLPAYFKIQQGWLSPRTMRTIKEVGKQVTLVLRDPGSIPAPTNSSSKWWGAPTVLLARVPIDPTLPAGYACPCLQGSCGASPTCQLDAQCGAGPCCVDAACADGNFNYYYIEFARSPVTGDYGGGGDYTGVTIRLAGGLRDCASTRWVPTHVAGGVAQYVMNRPDPQGKLPGSWFEDKMRRVIVRLDGMGQDWAQVTVLKY